MRLKMIRDLLFSLLIGGTVSEQTSENRKDTKQTFFKTYRFGQISFFF